MTTISDVSRTQVPIEQSFLRDVIDGLSRPHKQLNCKYFYDEQGSRLFDRICDVDEYYLTRTELSIMREHAGEMAKQLGSGIALVEFGSGSSVKTELLLDRLSAPVAYMPLDISRAHLFKTAIRLRTRYPEIEILPIVADFTQGFQLPRTSRPYAHAAVYFPGSTIGNFTPREARELLERTAKILGRDGGLLIGVDLQKDPAVIEAAYNDAEGLNAEFNLNLLHRINRELNADIRVEEFRHKAIYNELQGRVEISVVSQCDATIRIEDCEIVISKGEEILTEYSHKYAIESFVQLAAEAGFSLNRHWTDEKSYFAILHLIHDGQPTKQAR